MKEKRSIKTKSAAAALIAGGVFTAAALAVLGLVRRRRPAGPVEQTAAKVERTLTVPAAAEKLGEVTGFIDAFLQERGCPAKTQMQIDLSAEEIFVNVANYAYPETKGEVTVRLSEENGVVTLVFADAGVPYDPLQKEDPDVTLPAEERPIGGLGIWLVKKNMDVVSYRYENGKNVLTLKKRLRP